MRTVIIKNNEIINAICATAEEAQIAFPDFECIESNDWQIGWRRDEDGVFIRPEASFDKKAHNEAIIAALDEIDQKSIRPLRDGETERITLLRTQAAALRAQLIKE